MRGLLAQRGWRGHLYGRHFDDLLLLVLAKIRAQSKSDRLECANQTMEAKKTLIRLMWCPLQTVGRHPKLRGEALQDQLNLISSSSTLSDDMTAHAARIRSAARLKVVQFNDNLSARRALDQRPGPFKDCWWETKWRRRRGTGLTTPNVRRPALWREPKKTNLLPPLRHSSSTTHHKDSASSNLKECQLNI